MSLTTKDARELYENGKHRRYSLLFSVNGGAFAIAKILAGQDIVLGGLSLKQLSIGMVLFTAVMVWDIFEFGRLNRKEPIPEVFSGAGKAVLLLLGALICIGWLLVGFGGCLTTHSTGAESACFSSAGLEGLVRFFPVN